MGGRPVLHEDLVNLPNRLVLKLKIEDDDAVRLGNIELLHDRHMASFPRLPCAGCRT